MWRHAIDPISPKLVGADVFKQHDLAIQLLCLRDNDMNQSQFDLPAMTKALIFGAGGVGCTYGYILHNAGVDVTAVCRTNFEIVRQNGILIRSKIFGKCEHKPHTVKSPLEARFFGPFDYIIVASKALPGTAELIRDAVTSETAIVLAQNGIRIEEDYSRLYPQNTIISGVVYLLVTQVEPGIVEVGPLERFEFGTYPSKAPAAAKKQAETLAELWKAGGATVVVRYDFQSVRCLKLAVNAAWNPTSALTLCDVANFLRSSNTSETTIRKIMREIARVSTVEGHPDVITESAMDKDLERPKSRLTSGGKEPSMLTDVREHRALEVDAILGYTLKIAQRHVIGTPFVELLYTLAKARSYEIVRDDQWKPIARHD